MGRRESGQIPIIISCLTRQEFLGVLIDLEANGLRGCLFWHATWRARRFNGSPAFSEHIPIMFTPTSLSILLLSMQHQSLMGVWPDSLLPVWESGWRDYAIIFATHTHLCWVYVNLWVLMHWYTCKSILNTLGRTVEQLAGCLAKQQLRSKYNSMQRQRKGGFWIFNKMT